MKIVEYSAKYAAQVADMWNKSGENWGNEFSIKTEEDILQEESASGNLKLYLAIDNDEVVGYCSFSEYRGDEGASYLPLLNVRPDYHGKKVGKQLILTVLEDAIKSRWPRFDLYTWSGNIKAMPLYKKCGFFWEKKNNTVHLMNFIPYIYQTELLEEYMEQLDWYKDSKRVIDMDQDGELRGEFDMYSYEFSNDKTSLVLEFERKGRGLTLIHTPEYRIELKMKNQDVVFGQSYEVEFEVVTKTNTPIDLKIVGKDNKNLTFDFNYEGQVSDEVIKTNVFVGKIDKEQEEGKTLPVVEADVYVNGKLATFKLGLNPKFPIKTSLVVPRKAKQQGKEETCYLEVQNNFTERKEVSFKLKDSFVSFNNLEKIVLEPKEKRAIPVSYQLTEFGFYEENIQVLVGELQFENKLQGIFNGLSGSFTADMDKSAVIVSGKYLLSFEKNGREIILIREGDSDVSSAIMPPEIGLPYTLELHNTEPSIEFLNNNEMDLTYVSKDFPNTKLVVHITHYDGIATTQFELINEGEERELRVLCNVWQSLADGILPYKGKFLDITGYDGSGLGDVDDSFIDQNWIYEQQYNTGVTWEGEMKINGWKMAFESPLTTVGKGQSLFAPKVTFSVAHNNYKEFMEFAGYKEERLTRKHIELSANEGNPFYNDQYEVLIDNVRKVEFKGDKTINGTKSDLFKTEIEKSERLEVEVQTEDRIISMRKAMFKTSGTIDLSFEDGVYTVNNGVIEFKADEKYADSIYSLTKDGKEWLDSNYPTPSERSWWGSWIGGITYYMRGLPETVKQKESWTVEFASVHDNFSNEWEGIKSTLVVENEPELKGFKIENFYLTLPGVNVLMNVTKVTNSTGKVLSNRAFERILAVGRDLDEQVLVNVENQTFKCWDKGMEQKGDKYVNYTSLRKDILHVYSPNSEKVLPESQTEVNIMWDIHRHDFIDQVPKTLGNMFLIIGEENPKEAFVDLANIKVEV